MLASAPHRTHAAAESHNRDLLTMAATDRQAAAAPVTPMRLRLQHIARSWRAWGSALLACLARPRTAAERAAKTAQSI